MLDCWIDVAIFIGIAKFESFCQYFTTVCKKHVLKLKYLNNALSDF